MPELDNQELIERGCGAGALPYLMTDTISCELVRAVRTALRGERYPSQRRDER
jgi:DNA-binding NarL/FixJ family response regulator